MNIVRKPTFVLQALRALLQAPGDFISMLYTPDFSDILGHPAACGTTLLAINDAVSPISQIITGVLPKHFRMPRRTNLTVVDSTPSVVVIWMAAAVTSFQA